MPAPATSRTVERHDMPLCTRIAPIGSVNDDNRSVEITWTTGAGVRRYDWNRDRPYIEQLSQDADAVRMERLQSGMAPFLDTHSTWSLSDVLGVIESASAPADGGGAVVRFSKRAEVEPIFQDVKDKILNSVSLGARIFRMEMIAPDVEGNADWIYRAVDWEPYEISLVPIGADPGATVRSAATDARPNLYPCECIIVTRSDTAVTTNRAAAATQTTPKGNTMTPEEIQAAADAAAAQQNAGITRADPATPPAAVVAPDATTVERTRGRDIREAVRASTLDDRESLIDGYIDGGLSADAVRADVLRRMAERSAATTIRAQGGSRIETVVDETETRREAMIVAVMHRVAPGAVKLTDPARAYRGMTLRELCREGLEAAGISTRGMGPMDLAGAALGISQRAAHGTSDLPLIFGGVISRTLRSSYAAAPKTFTSWARPGTLSDFRPVTRASFDAAVKFEKVGQNGEYKYGRLQEGGEVIQLGTFGKIVAFTRQMIINDDLSALQRLPQFFGRAAADMESDLVYDVLLSNPKMSDGKQLFHADHSNIAAAGSAISIESLSAGRTAMRTQKSPGGGTLNLSAKTLLVPAALETIANQYTSSAYNPTKPGDINVFQGTLTPVVEARLDDKSATAWYLLADVGQIDTVEYAYLDGEEGLYTEQTTDFDVDGLKVKGRIDFAAKAIDYRGLYRNVGNQP